MSGSYITVSQLNRYIKFILSEDSKLRGVYVNGEISNFNRNYRSGHCYFSLKDSEASVKAVMFKASADRVKFDLEDGMSVIVRADVTLYERDGTYQLVVSDVIPYGAGAMALAFEQLKAKLAQKGLFDETFKKPIPRFPKKIAVVSSKTGAAIQDILNVLRRRMPYVEVELYPVSVQGDNTAMDVIAALDKVQMTSDADTIIIARGGGSSEDLFQFNNEALAYAIFNCKIPVISAIGHEVDFTICDFVADLRAPTPSAAAELVGASVSEITDRVSGLLSRAKTSAELKISENKYTVKNVYIPKITAKIRESLQKNRQSVDFLLKYSEKAVDSKISLLFSRFANDCARLETVNPFSVLKRGYAIVNDENGSQLVSKNQVKSGQKIDVRLKDGILNAIVTGVDEDDKQ